MKVKELFKQAVADDVVMSYLTMHVMFYSYERYPIQEKLQIIRRIQKAVEKTTKDFSMAEPAAGPESMRIFVVELSEESYEKQRGEYFSSFCVKEAEAREKAGTDFHVWDDAGESRIEHYGYDMTDLEELADYEVADISVQTYGIAACCAEILHQFFEFGFTEETRKNNKNKLSRKLKECEKNRGESRALRMEEVFGKLQQEMLENCEDEDTRQHMILEYEYEDKVREIEDRYRDKILSQNHNKIINFIKAEYREQCNDN